MTARPSTLPLPHRALRWVRETPAPEWGPERATRGRFVAYVAGSMAAWTVVGLGGSALTGALLRVVA